ncbi:MAG: SPFH domain-containing protein, partial [Fretibacterium sp.]|nr:SPFH domain-containing protein [Fretibacterium sp.]
MALLQIVEWDSGLNPSDVFAWRYVDRKHPEKSDALGNWTQLVVQESQEAVLFRDGQALDLFGPGRYTLSTDNIPLLRRLINLPTGGENPFKAHIWFVNKLNVLDIKWGTLSPLLLRDPEYQIPIPVRAYGQFGIRIRDSRKFLLKLVGTRTRLTREELIESFRGLLLSRIGDMIATYMTQKRINIFDISAYLRDMSDEAVDAVRPVFEEYGIEPANFFIGSVNVPDDDDAVLDLKEAMSERARMNLMGFSYQQKRSFDAMEQMAQASGGSGGDGGGNP